MPLPPNPAEFVVLDVAQRERVLLKALSEVTENERGENLILSQLHGWFPEIGGFGPVIVNGPARTADHREADRALRDAYSGLMSSGLIRPNPRAGNTFCDLTQAGVEALSHGYDPDAERIAFGRKALDGISLHSALRKRHVPDHFAQGKFETAIRDGSTFLEDAIRSQSGLSSLSGVRLVSKAFAAEGPLADPGRAGGEQVAIENLFAGFFGFVRNRVAHRDFRYPSNVEALETLLLLDYLTRRLAAEAGRLGSSLT